MIKIKRVGALEGGEMLDIQLENGHTILLDIVHLLNKPEFKGIKSHEGILNPVTDGYKVQWHNGPSLSVQEIMEMVQKNENGVRREARADG